MAAEIERKFLVKEGWQPQTEGVRIAQGYLSSVPERTVRVRIKGEKGFLTVKGRNESYGGFTWEVDVFAGANEGLVVAEIELPTEDAAFIKPHWIGAEVSGDVRYYNSSLIHHPYREWK